MPGSAVRGVQVPGSRAGGGLGSVLLRVPELGDCLGERGKPDDQPQPGLGGLCVALCCCGQQPCGLAQTGPARVGRGTRACGGRAVEAVGDLAEDPAVEGGGWARRVSPAAQAASAAAAGR
jgi:hypothetical protein